MRALVPVAVAACLLAGCGGSSNSPAPGPTQPAPSLTCPGNLAVNADGDTAVVDFAPTVNGGTPPVTVSCAPASGTPFTLGTTPVTCTATDAGSRTASCSFDVEVKRARRLSVTRFLAFGDSITEGFLREPPAFGEGLVFPQLVIETETYPYKLQKRLEETYPQQDFTVVNDGVGGETTAQGRARFLESLTRAKPEVVLLVMGYNRITQTPTNEAADDLRAMIRSAQVRDVDVIVATLFQVTDKREQERPGTKVAIDALNREIRSLAQQLRIGLVDLEAAFGDPPEPALVGSDGLHPTAAGYTRIADEFFDVIVSRYERDGAPGTTRLR
ncbi:MAG TPA: GDSL-type esterase/lipase family protein [Vicinamibacterales bacterium]